MDYEKVKMIECETNCMYREGEKCTLTLDRFKEHDANETVEQIKCVRQQYSNAYYSVEKQLKEEMGQKIIYTKNYEALREELKEELSKSVESFVRIGYLLKVARDTNILAESPYSNMEEFAYAEFKIDKGTASKFMAINDRFSEGGNSDRLKLEYSGIGWSKLSIMLQLPDSINEEISADFTKSEIQEIREELAEEEKITPIEHALEGETKITGATEDMLDKAIRQLGESTPELYADIHKAGQGNLDELKMMMAPAGEMIYSIRIRGIGRIMLSVKDYEETVKLINERTGEKEVRSWQEVKGAWEKIMDRSKDPEENWESVYELPFPKKEKVAPVQQENDAKKPKKKEIKKVVKVNEKPKQKTLHDIDKNIPAPDTIPEAPKEEVQEVQEQPEEMIPGQTDIETDMPELVPDNTKLEYIREIDKAMASAIENRQQLHWTKAKENLQNAIKYIELLEDLEEKEHE